MFGHTFALNHARLTALPTGALHWPEKGLLAVGDLHLGRSERTAREGHSLLPPYETLHTLDRLQAEIDSARPETLVLVGDSFDDMAAARDLADDILARIHRIAAGRRLVWIAGNHDPGQIDLPGDNLGSFRADPLVFRHIATTEGQGEVSGHYHPKARLTLRGQRISRPCFVVDRDRVILPAFGTYTGGLDVRNAAFSGLIRPDAMLLLTGRRITALPLCAAA